MTINVKDLPNLAAWRDAPRKRGRSKYRNEPTEVDGIKFDSKAEARRWLDLRVMQRAGLIRDLQRQVRYELVPEVERPGGGKERPIHYIADFVYVEAKTGKTIVEDVKGASPDVWVIKRKLMLWRHGIEVLEVRA